jgi:hypothetical protein
MSLMSRLFEGGSILFQLLFHFSNNIRALSFPCLHDTCVALVCVTFV